MVSESIDNSGRLAIKMLHDRLLIKVSAENGERRTSAGLVLPANAQVAQRLSWGEVLAVGNHVRSIETGDKVLFSPEDRHEVEVQGEEYVILRERDVHAIAAHRVEPSTGLYL